MTKLRRLIAGLLVVCINGVGLPSSAQAAMVTTDNAAAAADRARSASLLDRAEVRARLEAFGVNVADAKVRVAALTDEEAAQLAHQMDQLPAGADGGLAPLVGAVVLVFLVLLITDLLGLTHVFSFTKPVR